MGNEGVSTMNKPNCSTCPHFRSTHHGYECKESSIHLPLPAEAFIRYVGCLSHPGARDYLMADVIKELELQLKHNGTTIYYIPQIISLIRGDGK